MPGNATSLTLAISRIVQLEHSTRGSGGISETTVYNREHPSAQAPPTAAHSGRCRHSQPALQGRERRLGPPASPVAAAAAAVAPSAVFRFQRRQEEPES